MKALTIWQPWASLIMIGAKPYEFRRWDYRERERGLEGQRIVIHAYRPADPGAQLPLAGPLRRRHRRREPMGRRLGSDRKRGRGQPDQDLPQARCVLSGAGIMSRPPAYPSKLQLAYELDMAESTVDEMVKRGVLPPPREDGTFDWTEIVARMSALEKPSGKGTVYVVGFGFWVKIGFTTLPVKFRLAAIQTGAPEKLTVHAEIAADRSLERELHRRFQAHRSYGEWFRLVGAVDEWVRAGCPT